MKLLEMFSPIGAPKEDDQEIDWIDDLKYYIDNDTDSLSKYFFPAIKKHSKYIGHPKAFTLYMKPIEHCLGLYCKKFKIDDTTSKFPKDSLIKLAKTIATEQEKHIKSGNYR